MAQTVSPPPRKEQPAYIKEADRLIQRLGDPSKAIRYGLRKGASRESINYMIKEYNRAHHTKYTLNDWKKQAGLHPVTLAKPLKRTSQPEMRARQKSSWVDNVRSFIADPGLAIKNAADQSKPYIKTYVAKTASDIGRGLTLGALDLEKGKLFGREIDIPNFEDPRSPSYADNLKQSDLRKTQGITPLESMLMDSGVPLEIARNTTTSLGRTSDFLPFVKGTIFDFEVKPGEMVGMAAPVGAISKGVAKGVSPAFAKLARVTPEALKPYLPLLERYVSSGLTGSTANMIATGVSGGNPQQVLSSAPSGFALGVTLHTVGETMTAIAKAPTAAKNAIFNNATAKIAQAAYKEGTFKTLGEAQAAADKYLKSEIDAHGGIENIKLADAVKFNDFVNKAFPKEAKEPINITPKTGPDTTMVTSGAKPAVTGETKVTEKPSLAPPSKAISTKPDTARAEIPSQPLNVKTLDPDHVVSFTYEGQRISPSSFAADQQGATNDRYYNQDVFKDGVVGKGDLMVCVTYEGAKGPSGFFMPYEQYKQIVDTYGPDARILCDACQIAPYYDGDMKIAQDRTKVEIYSVDAPIEVAYGKVRANDQFGSGGATQIYMPKSQELVEQGFLTKVGERPLTNYIRDLDETENLLSDAEDRHDELYGGREEFKYKEKNIQIQDINRDLAPLAIQVEQFEEPTQSKTVSKTGAANSLEDIKDTTDQSLEETAAAQESVSKKENQNETVKARDIRNLNQNDLDTTPSTQWDKQDLLQRLETKDKTQSPQSLEETSDKPHLDSWYFAKPDDTELKEKPEKDPAQAREKPDDGFVWPKWFHEDYQQDNLSKSLGYESFDKLKEKAETCGEKDGVHYYASEDLKTGKMVVWKDRNYEKVAEFPDKQKWQELTQTRSWEQVMEKGMAKPENQTNPEKSGGMEFNR